MGQDCRGGWYCNSISNINYLRFFLTSNPARILNLVESRQIWYCRDFEITCYCKHLYSKRWNIDINFNEVINSAKSDHHSILHVCLYSLRVPQRQSNVFCLHHTPYPPELFMWKPTPAWEILNNIKRSIRQKNLGICSPVYKVSLRPLWSEIVPYSLLLFQEGSISRASSAGSNLCFNYVIWYLISWNKIILKDLQDPTMIFREGRHKNDEDRSFSCPDWAHLVRA